MSTSTITDLVAATTKAGKATVAERATEASAAVLEPLSILMHQVSKGKRSPKDLAPLAEQAEAILNGTAVTPRPESRTELQNILNDPSLSDGQKKALQRILVPTDPEFIEVDNAGTPKVIARLQTEVTGLQTKVEEANTRADKAEKKATPDNAVLKTDVAKDLIGFAKSATDLKASTLGHEIKGQSTLVKDLRAAAVKYGAKENDEKDSE